MKEHTIPIPKGTCLVCLSGLGGSQKNFPDLRAGPGEINLHYSTDDTAGAGFHPRTESFEHPLVICQEDACSQQHDSLHYTPMVSC